MEPQEFWYLGIDNVIRTLFADPDWMKLHGRHRGDFVTAADLHGASMCTGINARTNGKFDELGSSGYELGFDFCQIFTSSQHSIGNVFARYALGFSCGFFTEGMIALAPASQLCVECEGGDMVASESFVLVRVLAHCIICHSDD